MSGAPIDRGRTAGRARGSRGGYGPQRGAMAPQAQNSGPSVQQAAVPVYRPAVDEIRKRVMKAANLFRSFDPEVYPRITFRSHGIEEVELYLHSVPGRSDGWVSYQHAVDVILPLFKREDEERKIRSRGPTRLGRDLSDVDIAEISRQDREILLMSNKEYQNRFPSGFQAVKPEVPVTPELATEVAAQKESELAARISQLEATIVALRERKALPSPGDRVIGADYRHRGLFEETDEEEDKEPPEPALEPAGGTYVPPRPGSTIPEPTTVPSPGGSRKPPAPSTST